MNKKNSQVLIETGLNGNLESQTKQQVGKTSTYAIITSFARSFDVSHNNNNRIHLVSSTYLADNINDLLANIVRTRSTDYTYKSEELTIYIIFSDIQFEFLYKNNVDRIILRTGGNGQTLVFSTIERLVDNFGFIRKGESNIFTRVLGDNHHKSKDFNNLLNNSIFIFIDQF